MANLDIELFNNRIKRLYSFWKTKKNEKEKMDAICFVSGTNREGLYCKTASIQVWLFGLEISGDAGIFLLENQIVFIASPKKIAFLKQIDPGKENETFLEYKFIVRNKNDSNQTVFKDAIRLLFSSGDGHRIGCLPNEKYEGDFVKDWEKAVDKAGFEKVDANLFIASVLAVKDDIELAILKKAAEISDQIFIKYLKEQFISIIENQKKVKHSKLSMGVEKALDNKNFVPESDQKLVEVCYSAIIQSGGNYCLKFSAESDENDLHPGTIISALGIRYKSYCSNLVRTIMFNPTVQMQQNYKLLLSLEEYLINALQDGVELCGLYKKIKKKCEDENSVMAEKLTPNFGFLIGIEFRETTFQISDTCSMTAKAGMVFQVRVGFSDLTNPEAKDECGKNYALFVGDTVQVNKSGPASLFTQAKKKFESTALVLNDVGNKENREKDGGDIPMEVQSNIIEVKREGQKNLSRRPSFEDEKLRSHKKLKRDHQPNSNNLNENEQIVKTFKQFAYRSQDQLPYKRSEVKELKIHVDTVNETILLPIYGLPTPFHISRLEKTTAWAQGDYDFIHLSFFHPDVVATASNTDSHLENVHVKELTFRELNIERFGEKPSMNLKKSFELIQRMQREYKEKEKMASFLLENKANSTAIFNQVKDKFASIEKFINEDRITSLDEIKCEFDCVVNEVRSLEKLVTDKAEKINFEEKKKDVNILFYSNIIKSTPQATDLINLCEFDFFRKFVLIYRASRDGFGAEPFHAKVNNVPNTFFIIKVKDSPNIFGGFTQCGWDSTSSEKKDNSSFIFSLVNEKNKPIKIKAKDDAIVFCNRANQHIAFGCNSAGYCLLIQPDSNVSNSQMGNSYSNLYGTFVHPKYKQGSSEAKSFLARTHEFCTSEIEVFKVV